MPFCGFNQKMIHGLAEFTKGLYEQALKRSREESITVERAFEIEVAEMTIFLAKLDEKYYDELRPKYDVATAQEQLIEWAAFYPKK